MEYVEHQGEKYLSINACEYVKAHTDALLVGSKFASVTARKGKVGERIDTKMNNGLEETKNFVTYDTATGEPSWVVTQASGEQMVVEDAKYRNLYEVQDVKEGEVVKPSGKYRPMVRVNENVALMTSWGELQYIKAGGVLVVIDSKDIYGIQKTEFEGSYNVIENADAKALFEENLSKVATSSRKPTIFLSVAYPYENLDNQNFMKQVIKYVNSKGLKAVNIRRIEENNLSLINEISKALKESDGILSLAFNKGGDSTSPFIQIENTLALSLNLSNLMIVPSNVKKEGVLYDSKNLCEIKNEKDLFANENNEIIENLDKFIEDVANRFANKINDKDLAKFKEGLVNLQSANMTKKELVEYLERFYRVKDKKFSFNDVYVKRQTIIKATVIEESGFYKTQEGNIYLNKGDFLVDDIDGNVLPYHIKEEEFKARYVKMQGREDAYISKVIPTVAMSKGDKMEVYNLANTNDVYDMDKGRFKLGYQTLYDYILGLESELALNDDNIKEL